jgi:thioredoxin 1
MSHNVAEVTDAEFNAQVLQSDKPVLVDFWATWCGPCRMIAPEVEKLAEEMGDQVTVLKMNIDQNPIIPPQLQIQSIPTLIIFNGGVATERVMGYRQGIGKDLKQMLEALLVS